MVETEEAGQPSLGDGWQSTNNDNITNDGNRRYARGSRGSRSDVQRNVFSLPGNEQFPNGQNSQVF